MRVFKLVHYLAVLSAIILFLCSGGYAQRASDSPKMVVKEMLDVYENASSYQDTGFVRVLSGDSSLIANSKISYSSLSDAPAISFKIYYSRPANFRFDWTSRYSGNQREAIIWFEGKKAYQWSPMRYSPNAFALAGGASLSFYVDESMPSSGGAVFVVPGLLLKDIAPLPFSRMIAGMTDLSLGVHEEVEGEQCKVVKGNIYGTPWMLWIGEESHLLRKTRTLYSGQSFHEKAGKGSNQTQIAEEVHTSIRINEKVSSEIFKYRPTLGPYDVDMTVNKSPKNRPND
jgi:hypothetical protein